MANLAGLGHALGRPLDDGLVDTLLDNLISDVIRAVDVESLFVETKSDRERRIRCVVSSGIGSRSRS
jgi:hypothetical protein